MMRRVEHGAPNARCRAPAVPGSHPEQVAAAVELVYGWDGDGPRGRIAPARTVDGFTAAAPRVLEVARARWSTRVRDRAPGVPARAPPPARGARRQPRAAMCSTRSARPRRSVPAVGAVRWIDQRRGAHRRRASARRRHASTPPKSGSSRWRAPTSSSPTTASRAWRSARASRWWPSPTSTRSRWRSRPGRAGPSGSSRSTTAAPRTPTPLLDLLEIPRRPPRSTRSRWPSDACPRRPGS